VEDLGTVPPQTTADRCRRRPASWKHASASRAFCARSNQPSFTPFHTHTLGEHPSETVGRTGRSIFISVDPLVNETGQPYQYTGDNPVNSTDPLGLCSGFLGCIGSGISTAAGAVGGAATATAGFVANHAGTVATVASLAALAIPGVDVIDLGVVAGISVNGALALTANAVAIGTGGVASGQDFSQGHYVSGAFDLVGTIGGLSALHLQGLANLKELAAAEAWRFPGQSWLAENAAQYAAAARVTAFGAFGLGALPSIGSFVSGTPAWADTPCG
jgi:hypothetical protein